MTWNTLADNVAVTDALQQVPSINISSLLRFTISFSATAGQRSGIDIFFIYPLDGSYSERYHIPFSDIPLIKVIPFPNSDYTSRNIYFSTSKVPFANYIQMNLTVEENTDGSYLDQLNTFVAQQQQINQQLQQLVGY